MSATSHYMNLINDDSGVYETLQYLQEEQSRTLETFYGIKLDEYYPEDNSHHLIFKYEDDDDFDTQESESDESEDEDDVVIIGRKFSR
jgi:hypothetical protein